MVSEAVGALPIEAELKIVPDGLSPSEFGCDVIDVSGSAPSDNGGFGPLRVGQETLVVNASLMGTHMRPVNAPIIIDMDLPIVAEKR